MLRQLLPALVLFALPTVQAQSPLLPTALEAILVPDSPTNNIRMGDVLAYDGDRLLVGAPSSSTGGQAGDGEAFVFERDGSGWTQTANLVAPTPGTFEQFGISVALDGDRIVIGAPGDVGQEFGGAYVYDYDGTSWQLSDHLFENLPENKDANYGGAVALDGDRIYVAATGHERALGGAVFVYFFDGAGWVLESRLLPQEPIVAARMGSSLSASGDWLLAGAVPGGGETPGMVYAFQRTASGWVEEAVLESDNPSTEFGFGRTVSLDGDRALVGEDERPGSTSQGSVTVFERTGTTWTQTARLTAASGQTGRFGSSHSLTDSVAVVGAPRVDDLTGRAYVFELTDGGWLQRDVLFADDRQDGDAFGAAVDYANGRAVVSAPGREDDSGRDKGAAYVFGGVIVDSEDDPRSGEASLSAPSPNPSRGAARLTLSVETPQAVRAVVLDALGRQVATLFDGVAVGETEIRVDTSALPTGVYMVRVTGETVSAARRLTVVR